MASRRAKTPEARENQLINLAVDLAEKQLSEGTASSMVITHYLRMGSPKERLEREKLERENDHLKAKIAVLESGQRSDEMYTRALKAFGIYSGNSEESLEDD